MYTAIVGIFHLAIKFTALLDHLLASQFIDHTSTDATIQLGPNLRNRFSQIAREFESLQKFIIHSLEILTTNGRVLHCTFHWLALGHIRGEEPSSVYISSCRTH
jgi:hypothetical protein